MILKFIVSLQKLQSSTKSTIQSTSIFALYCLYHPGTCYHSVIVVRCLVGCSIDGSNPLSQTAVPN